MTKKRPRSPEVSTTRKSSKTSTSTKRNLMLVCPLYAHAKEGNPVVHPCEEKSFPTIDKLKYSFFNLTFLAVWLTGEIANIFAESIR